MDRIHLYNLLEAYAENRITPQERKELLNVFADTSFSNDIQEWIAEKWLQKELPELLQPEQSAQLYESILREIAPKSGKLRLIRRMTIAAAAVLAITAGVYFWPGKVDKHSGSSAKIAVNKDIKAPDATKARITLANGEVLYIDSLGKGEMAHQEGVQIIKSDDGQIEYKGSADVISYNTLSNPRGSDVVAITLSDGTRVWLNASSGITYPAAFAKKERRVELSGEAYFEVAKNADSPFIVDIKGRAEVRVLGTHFNIMAYEDDSQIRTSLLEGSVEVSQNLNTSVARSFRLVPGQQALVEQNGECRIAQIDVNEIIAWKEGKFNFNDTNLESIMKSVSRWYNVDIEYENDGLRRLTFGGIVSRGSNVSEILHLMELTGTVSFQITAEKIIVKANK